MVPTLIWPGVSLRIACCTVSIEVCGARVAQLRHICARLTIQRIQPLPPPPFRKQEHPSRHTAEASSYQRSLPEARAALSQNGASTGSGSHQASQGMAELCQRASIAANLEFLLHVRSSAAVMAPRAWCVATSMSCRSFENLHRHGARRSTSRRATNTPTSPCNVATS